MMIKHEVLREDELPKPGTLVAIDAEFVEMQSVSCVVPPLSDVSDR